MANTTHTSEKGNTGARMGEPPKFEVKVPKEKDLPSRTSPWEDIETKFLPVDYLLLTAKDCEFRSCLAFLHNIKRGYERDLGPVYFGFNSQKESKFKIAVIKCAMGSAGPSGSIVVVRDAVPLLRPRAVICVGYCGSLDEKKAKLGDVIVSSKLTTYALTKEWEDGIEECGFVIPPNKNMANLIKHVEEGWEAPLTNADDLKVKIRSDGDFLSGPKLLNDPKRLKELKKRFRQGTAIEIEGEGLYTAAHNRGIEWLVIKGVSDFADDSKSGTDPWRLFASVMAASVVFHMLNDHNWFKEGPHYENLKKRKRRSSTTDYPRAKVTRGESYAEDAEPGPSTRRELPSSRPGHENTKEDAATLSSSRNIQSIRGVKEEVKSGSWATSLYWRKNISVEESKECRIDGQGTTWNLTNIEAGARITFTRYAVSMPLLLRCKLSRKTIYFPFLNEDEELVSSVVELTCDERPSILIVGEGNGEVTIAFSHSAPKLEGYEVVIRKVVSSKRSYVWKDLETTNIWKKSDDQDDFKKSMVPYAEAKVAHCGFYAVIFRLKSFTYSIPVSGNEEITRRIPEYPEVSVTIPARNFEGKTKLELGLKVQEIPRNWFNSGEDFAGPVLHITCPQITHLLTEPATITLPVILQEDKDELSRFSNSYIRVFGSPFDDESSGWDELTGQLPNRPVLTNGVVTFQVQHFSRITVWLTKAWAGSRRLCRRILRFTKGKPIEAGFLACLCNTVSGKAQLQVYCYPTHLRSKVENEVCSAPNVDRYGNGDSLEPLLNNDKIIVEPWNRCQAKKTLTLRFRSDDMFKNSVEVQLPCEPTTPCVEFISTLEEPLCEFSIDTPCQRRTEHTHRDLVKAGTPSNDELEELSLELGEKWEELARRLRYDQAAISNFDANSRSINRLASSAYSMLLAWKQREASKATYKVLYNALCHELVQCNLLAQKFCCVRL